MLGDMVPVYGTVRTRVNAKLLLDGKLTSRPVPQSPVGVRELLTVKDVYEFAADRIIGSISHVLVGLMDGEVRSVADDIDPVELPWFAVFARKRLTWLRQELRPMIRCEVYVDKHPSTGETIVCVRMNARLEKTVREALASREYLPWITGTGEFYISVT